MDPDHAITIGNYLLAAGSIGEAIATFDEALNANPTAALYFYRGGAHLKNKSPAEAMADFDAALTLNPNMAEAYVNKGWLLQGQGNVTDALPLYERALTLQPDNPEILRNLSGLYLNIGQYDSAEALLTRLQDLAPDMPGLYINLGTLAEQRHQFDQALAYFDEALVRDPQNSKALWNRIYIQLKLGHFDLGLPTVDLRLKLAPELYAQPTPRWDGQKVRDKTILVLSEGGYGDAFQFYRYLPWVKARCKKVIFCCRTETTALFAQCQGYDVLIEDTQSVTEHDYHVYLISLPHLARTTLETIPYEVPYLKTSSALQAKWEAYFKTIPLLKVGLVWAGSENNPQGKVRNCPPEYYNALGAFKAIQFFSLQKGTMAWPHLSHPPQLNVIDLSSQLVDFHETAAVIQQLDLVITIDTGVAHLAGALAKPVWVILPHASDWRWLYNRTDSPWYPTMRLFQQPAHGDWGSVFVEVNQALKQLFNER